MLTLGCATGTLRETHKQNLHDVNVMRSFTNCMMGEYMVDEFEHQWWCMINHFGLQHNEWLRSMYEIMPLWAKPLMKGNFLLECEAHNVRN